MEALQFSQSSQVAELQSRLNTLGQELINIFNDFSEYSREAREVSERLQAYVEGEIQDYRTFAEEQTKRIEVIKAEAQRQIEEISNDINYYVEEEDRKLKAIVGQMESEYGARYAEFAGIGPLLESGDFDKLNSALFELRAAGGSKTEEAYSIAVSMQMGQVNLAAITGHLNSRNSLLQSMVDELSRLSSGMQVDEREIAALKEELLRRPKLFRHSRH